MNSHSQPALIFATLAWLFVSSFQPAAIAQGSLTPPGAPGPLFKTLNQVEPRTPLSAGPITISVPGSYYLTTNFTAGFANGITIVTNGVALDLNGFAVDGAGIGFTGILVSGNRTNITVRNGTVTGWTSYGIDARNCYVGSFEGMRVVQNGSVGLACGRRGRVQACLSASNSGDGFYVGGDNVVENCIAEYNGQHGINDFEGGCRIDNNHVLHNAGFGIYIPNGGNLVVRNAAQANGTNYNIFSFNSVGPTNVGPGIVTNHPWANFSF